MSLKALNDIKYLLREFPIAQVEIISIKVETIQLLRFDNRLSLKNLIIISCRLQLLKAFDIKTPLKLNSFSELSLSSLKTDFHSHVITRAKSWKFIHQRKISCVQIMKTNLNSAQDFTFYQQICSDSERKNSRKINILCDKILSINSACKHSFDAFQNLFRLSKVSDNFSFLVRKAFNGFTSGWKCKVILKTC